MTRIRSKKLNSTQKSILWLVASPILIVLWTATIAKIIALFVPNLTYIDVISCGFTWLCTIIFGTIATIAFLSQNDDSL